MNFLTLLIMKLWILAFTLLPLLGTVYVCWHIFRIVPLTPGDKLLCSVLFGLGLVMMVCSFVFDIDALPFPLAVTMYQGGACWIFWLLYAVLIFLVLDLGRLFRVVPDTFLTNSWAGTLTVLGLMLVIFIYGNIHYYNKERVELTVKTDKPLPKPLKIVMASDLHLGYVNRKAEFQRWLDMIYMEKPDLVLIAGDIIDGSHHAVRVQQMDQMFVQLGCPIYACLGNHEYIRGVDESVAFYHDAGIRLLRDGVAHTQGINIIGRDDDSNKGRMSLEELSFRCDPARFTILLDHQPYRLEEAQKAGVDFQFSGHTHYGQMWPLSWITDAIFEDAFGPYKKGNTQYYVSSGLGIWGSPFRVGTRSEFVVLTLLPR